MNVLVVIFLCKYKADVALNACHSRFQFLSNQIDMSKSVILGLFCLISFCYAKPFPREVICRHIYPIPCYIVNIEIKNYNAISKGI